MYCHHIFTHLSLLSPVPSPPQQQVQVLVAMTTADLSHSLSLTLFPTKGKRYRPLEIRHSIGLRDVVGVVDITVEFAVQSAVRVNIIKLPKRNRSDDISVCCIPSSKLHNIISFSSVYYIIHTRKAESFTVYYIIVHCS